MATKPKKIETELREHLADLRRLCQVGAIENGAEPSEHLLKAIEHTFSKLIDLEKHGSSVSEVGKRVEDLRPVFQKIDKEFEKIWARLNANASPASMTRQPKRRENMRP